VFDLNPRLSDDQKGGKGLSIQCRALAEQGRGSIVTNFRFEDWLNFRFLIVCFHFQRERNQIVALDKQTFLVPIVMIKAKHCRLDRLSKSI
jgi:hypothetical protein